MNDVTRDNGGHDSGLAHKTILAVADQAVVSAANLAVNLALIRWGTPEEYGLFVVVQAALLFVVGVHAALITAPMTVTLAGEDAARRGRWLLPLLIGPCLAPGAVGLAIAFVLSSGAGGEAGPLGLVAVASVASAAVLFREFMRAWYYAALKPGSVLAIDVGYLTILLGYFWSTAGDPPTASGAVMSVAFASAAVGALALAAALRSARVAERLPWSACRRLFALGQWGVLGSMVTWCQTQSYVYLLLAMVGASATAAASASRIVFAPLALVTSGWGAVYKPWGARISGADSERLHGPMVDATTRLTLLSVMYGLVAVAAHAPLVEHILGDRYRGIGRADLALWAVYFAILAIRGGLTNTLQVLQQFRALFFCSLGGAVVAVLAGAALIAFYGVLGSLVGLIAGEIVLTLAALRCLTLVWRKPGWVRWLFVETARR